MADKNVQPFDIKAMEKWLENFFLDPLTSYMDEIAFRVDIFETETEIIVEALLPGYERSHLSVYVEDNVLTISANHKPNQKAYNHHTRTRKMEFPCSIINKQIHAVFQNGILEVILSKTTPGTGKNRKIAIS
ncbi:Hsp20/alpha crystallin family protein [Bacillus methanolicus]|uniref:Hsp20/alpha crystallin family protein n=1 Tax=Bacillus methanolicus TaxID=1471 RepID=UPI00200C4842|nr:Hsp20/alpha crystallin family protein [Bacillus methanolicus]UQD51898.1 Hsp20/alpha crystallin family protein [Bacillus methanolicus]